jgi:hypothetical protein
MCQRVEIALVNLFLTCLGLVFGKGVLEGKYVLNNTG